MVTRTRSATKFKTTAGGVRGRSTTRASQTKRSVSRRGKASTARSTSARKTTSARGKVGSNFSPYKGRSSSSSYKRSVARRDMDSCH